MSTASAGRGGRCIHHGRKAPLFHRPYTPASPIVGLSGTQHRNLAASLRLRLSAPVASSRAMSLEPFGRFIDRLALPRIHPRVGWWWRRGWPPRPRGRGWRLPRACISAACAWPQLGPMAPTKSQRSTKLCTNCNRSWDVPIWSTPPTHVPGRCHAQCHGASQSLCPRSRPPTQLPLPLARETDQQEGKQKETRCRGIPRRTRQLKAGRQMPRIARKQEGRQKETEGRQKETEGRQGGHSDQQEGRQDRRQRETEGR